MCKRQRTNYTYNAANQLVSDGTNTLTYDNNGNMTSDGVNSYTWDRANRLLSMGGVDYQYDGEGRRVQQTMSSVVTKYLLDIQPGLSVVLSETTGSNVVRNVHAPKGIHARKDASSNWHWLIQDGLGSVRAEVSNSISVEGSQNFAPYGSSVDALGSFGTYGFTGEPTDVNGLVYDRARYYVPSIGMFASLDPFEGIEDEPMSMNGYSYVHGNPVNWTDPTGEFVNVIAGAAVGFGVGAIAGFGVTAAFLIAAQSGACGKCLQDQLQSMSPLETFGFLGRATLQSAAVGGLLGAVAGLGPLGAVFSGAVTGLLGYDALKNGLDDIGKNGLNPCNAGQTVLGGLGLIGGATMAVGGALKLAKGYFGNTSTVNNTGTAVNSKGQPVQYTELPDGSLLFEDGTVLGGNGGGKGYVSGFLEVLSKARKGGFESEFEAARALSKEGFNVHFRTAAGDTGTQNVRTSDLLVGGEIGTGRNGIPFEVYTPETGNPGRVSGQLATKLTQADRFIIVLDKTTLNPSDLSNLIPRVNGIPNILQPLQEVYFVRDVNVIGHLP